MPKPLLSCLARACAAILLVAGSWSWLRADELPDVRKLMTEEEFRNAGLERLNEQEIEALNRWVLRYTAREAPVVRRSEVVREEIRKVEAEVIRTRIDGAFRGWSGKTVFRLQNGQTWRQRQDGKFHFRADSPEVEIRKNLLGFWMLRVLDADRAVGVTRIN